MTKSAHNCPRRLLLSILGRCGRNNFLQARLPSRHPTQQWTESLKRECQAMTPTTANWLTDVAPHSQGAKYSRSYYCLMPVKRVRVTISCSKRSIPGNFLMNLRTHFAWCMNGISTSFQSVSMDAGLLFMASNSAGCTEHELLLTEMSIQDNGNIQDVKVS